MTPGFFHGRRLMIATKHGKEKLLAPIVEPALGVRCDTLATIDTDQFGTFSGEVERRLSVIDTARAKCDLAHSLTGCDLVLSSEGTFGPHPYFSFVPSDHELLLLKDYQHDLEITGTALSLNTNFQQQQVASFAELVDFSRAVGFPAHAVIVYDAPDKRHLFKGISDIGRLKVTYDELRRYAEKVMVETDMRAHLNPTRQTVIAEAASDLVRASMSVCPNCDTPGFIVRKVERGLPCALCGAPTQSVLKQIRDCSKCGHSVEELYPEGKEKEEPGYCGECNP